VDIGVSVKCVTAQTTRRGMDYRQKNINDQLDRDGIVIASLKVADKKCVVCAENSLRILGNGFDGRTKYICTNKICNCRFSLA